MAVLIVNTATDARYLLSGGILVALADPAPSDIPVLRVGAADWTAINTAFTGP